tara:strand:+ start:4550 stop:4693 length:144 start_codon:yes stop_codon:yes gene_type:complete
MSKKDSSYDFDPFVRKTGYTKSEVKRKKQSEGIFVIVIIFALFRGLN